MDNLTKKESVEGARDFEQERTGERDSSKEFARAEHQARNDAVGTDFEVREAKQETASVNQDNSQPADDSQSSDGSDTE